MGLFRNKTNAKENEMLSLELYKSFIDGIVKIHKNVKSKWILANGSYPKTEDNTKINALIAKLNDEERETLAKMLQDAKDGGIHDVLAYMNEQAQCDGLEIQKNGVKLKIDKFESMHFDFICRINGDEWPEYNIRYKP